MKQVLYFRLVYIFMFCSFLPLNVGIGQDSIPNKIQTKSISKQVLQKRVDELEYDKKKTIYTLKEFSKKEEDEVKLPRNPGINLSSIGTILKLILYLGLAVFIIAMIYFIFKDIKEKKINLNRKFSINENFEVDDIENLQIDDILEDALRDGNYRFAVRLHFLRVLQILQEKKLVKWKKNKTNRTYIGELLDVDQRFGFKKLAGIFDNIWYGNIELSIDEYEYVAKQFDSFKQTLLS